MTNSDQRVGAHHQTPAAIRDVTFQRRMLGLDGDKVYEYLDQLADQVQANERALGEARAENERLHAELQRARAELDELDQVGGRVNEQVVELFSQAQLVAEEMVQDVSRDARERIGMARAHERQIVDAALSTAGDQVRSYARTARAQMESVMESFAKEVERLGSPSLSDGPPAAARPMDDPLFGHSGDWPIRVRNGSGPDTPGAR
jgi:DivIVA domain-containing protein